MVRLADQEQEQLWESVEILTKIDKEKAKTVFKAAVEKTFWQLQFAPTFLSSIRFTAPTTDQLVKLRETEKRVREAYNHEQKIEAYEYLLEYIEQFSELSEENTALTRRKLLASLLAQQNRSRKPARIKRPVYKGKIVTSEEGKSFYTTSEAAEKLGLSDQTIRRMCERGSIPKAYKTDGGHWRIPQEAFITTPKHDKKAQEFLRRMDMKNKEAGDVDEFDL
ncbi:helix-turn-helix domain-containing protein [Neobacillus sp. YIM B02564]|uniref:Helix-turn-helix domain-containing protein n=1 Tax=Neobacillus paridis TaxID=2803862 RepID=A0ABS1TL51_9BACI|nr:helix-turn-helix domain-containing protein [Neobacillus paridis]MBL4952043.1 helix-turn-helix domain-containing protein [Neobacillus paridis]